MFNHAVKKSAKINLTPLIDIIFQLVIFFMLSTTFIKTEALDVFVAAQSEPKPQAEYAKKLQPNTHDENFMIEIFSSEEIIINGVQEDIANIDEIIAKRLKTRPKQKIDLIVKDGAKVQELVDIIDIVKKSNAGNISIDSSN